MSAPVTDIQQSIAFYEKQVQRLIVKSLPDYARFACSEGDSTFSLHWVDKPADASGTWIYFEVGKLDDVVKDLMDKGIVFDELPNDKPWLWREAKLKDPNNNQLILYFAGVNRKDPPWKF